MASTGKAYHIDWEVSNNSNIHVANDRNWFTTFTPFKTYYGYLADGSPLEVEGVGIVEIQVKRYNSKHKNKPNYTTIQMHNVLYVPSLLYNICGHPEHITYYTSLAPSNTGRVLKTMEGRRIGLIDQPRWDRLRLRGQNAKQTSLRPEVNYFINAIWPDSERQRWLEYSEDIPSEYKGNTPYTTKEKAWLKRSYGNEWRFLRAFGLRYNKKERAEGRAIVRGIMEDEHDRGSSCSSDRCMLFDGVEEE